MTDERPETGVAERMFPAPVDWGIAEESQAVANVALVDRMDARFGPPTRSVVVALAYDTARAAIHGIANTMKLPG